MTSTFTSRGADHQSLYPGPYKKGTVSVSLGLVDFFSQELFFSQEPNMALMLTSN